jgi:hypothetical protein
MNRTTEKLQAQYAARFLVTATCVGAAVIAARLIWFGKTGDHVLPAIGVAIVTGYVAWRGTVDLCRRWKQLKQLSALQERGPYDTREYVSPHDAARQLGDDDPNMWA